MICSKKIIAVSLIALFGATACASAGVTSLAPQEYLDWLEELKKEMVEKGISQKTIDRVYEFDYYHPVPDAVKKDRKQLEFLLTSNDYLNRVVSKTRVEKGQKK